MINISNAGILAYFARSGFAYPGTSNPPPGIHSRVGLGTPSFERYKYLFDDASGNRWFFFREGGGMKVVASQGFSGGRSVNWYFDRCSFR